ncbi:hypothetical protein A2160_02870 [Candidatus Beckwithbacteria bacterium RBG_13_42_9]|uniref:Glycosyl transferase family 1 domain-containing protein n=1 Tax=Candidatus Beckwithbacteria bacterium RBG_13_42_9 TaxID=1797457 RepID=A0A1F5E7Q2_9BACT|nr:MAG: hypothetical protein A2160_02870 [Candidatus Beckwithbacteria bacterium RBG_13_42_9]
MKVALEISSLSNAHQVRGIGFYTQRLSHNLRKIAKRDKSFSLVEFSGSVKERVDLIHYPFFHPFFRTLPLIKLTKTVVTIHDLIPLKFPKAFPSGLKGSLRWQLQRMALLNTRAIITDSNFSKVDIVRFTHFPEEKIFVIYLAADSAFKEIHNQRYLSRLRQRYQLPSKFVLYVGDLNWNKNVPLLVKVCLQLNCPLVIVGKQALVQEFDHLHSENQDLIRFQELAAQNPQKILRLGFVPTEDLVGIYNLATCYVHPSFAEGFGLPILEAMASGCPVVTSKDTSLSEIAGGAALLVDPHKREELAEAITLLWQKLGVRRRQVSQGLKQAKNFSWTKTAKETLGVYQKVSESLE